MARAGSRVLGATALALAALAAGCQLVIGLDGGHAREGTGGASSSASVSSGGLGGASSEATSSSSATSSSGTGGASSSASSSSSGSGGAGGSATSSSSGVTCPDGGTTCAAPSCTDGIQDGTETGVDCGGATCGPCTLLLLAGGASGLLGGSFAPVGGAWTATTLAGVTTDALALTVVPATGQGVGLLHVTKTGDPTTDQLQYTTWSLGTWAAVAEVGLDTTRAAPALSASGATAQAVFQGTDFKFYYAACTGGAWSPTAEPVGGATPSYGPSAPALALVGGAATLAFFSGATFDTAVNNLFGQDHTGPGAWTAGVEIVHDGTGTLDYGSTPALAALTAGPELMAAYTQSDDHTVRAATRTGGAWSAPKMLAAASMDPVALLALPGGEVMLAFRGTNNLPYAMHFKGGAWLAPVALSSDVLAAPPAVARGAGSAVAELAYATAGGAVLHARYDGSAWSTPAPVGAANGYVHVALAAGP